MNFLDINVINIVDVNIMHLVSIVMPAYNAEDTIADSIESVLKQSYSNFELIICDDSSTDETRKIVESLSKRDSRVKLIENNYLRGAAGARNSCILEANGRFIAFLDSDDLWHEDKLNTQIKFMLDKDIAMSHGSYAMFNDEEKLDVITAPREISFTNIVKRCNIGCLTVMLDTNKIKNILFPYSPKEDYALWVVLMKSGVKSYLYPGQLAYYRKQANSLSSSKIKEVSKQWYVLKNVAKINFFLRLVFVSTYILNGLIKHYRVG